MDLTGALALCRFVRDGAALLLWGSSVYLLLAPPLVRAHLTGSCARWRHAAVLALVAAASALLPVQAASLGEGWPDALDPGTIGALLFGTSIGAAWLIQAAVATALLLGSKPHHRWHRGSTAVLAAVLLASLTLTGHAAMHEGWLGLAHRANDLLHMLAGGFWFGALPPLLPTLALLDDRHRHAAAIVTLRRFSTAGHAAVAAVLASGIANTFLVLGHWPINLDSPYQCLLWAKILLVVAMTALALLNRYAFVPRLRDGPACDVRRIRNATLAEVMLGAGAIALVAVFGLLDPA